ncbi:hypothetical protein [Sunxiuqinia elliptica]|uniref:Uncharacterized protein n=1 Tax=Sunxiuqinia elliptica TaxID=655355 RepID=A0A4R6GYJ6_9BACT|nr:hypothetical protein [Sunxiuqinia elliptica]TDN99925.1 hypothetical protein DET52_106138 [Sunxiuqinia elliptica]TDO57117.1 hypothetical protein DET65_3702 [Sunxiuqinia elliptica]
MKRIKSAFLVCALVLISFLGYAQTDSVKVSKVINPEYDFIYRELFNFLPNSTFGGIETVPSLSVPMKFDLQPEWVIDYNSYAGFKTLSLTNQAPVFNPWLGSLSVTNQAHYNLNDRLVVGGNSFAGSTIFDNMPANPSLKDMSIRGASMFLQYNISKKVKLSGSFSISNENHPFIP